MCADFIITNPCSGCEMNQIEHPDKAAHCLACKKQHAENKALIEAALETCTPILTERVSL